MRPIQIILNLGWWRRLDIVGLTYIEEICTNEISGYWWCRFLMFEIIIWDKEV